jgi:archaeosine synthase beta-subunit
MTLRSEVNPTPRPRREFNPFQPQGFFLEHEPQPDGYIASVATVLLTNRECPWRCVYCDLWKQTTTASVPVGAIPAQIDFALRSIATPSNQPIHLKLYNAGSFFDPKAISPADWPSIAERAATFDRVIVECHPALVGERVLGFQRLLEAAAGRPQVLEVAMGLEIASDEILARLNKRMTLELFRRAARFLVEHGMAVRAFVMVKPPFVRTDAEGVEWAARTVTFAFDCGASVVSLIPARWADGLRSLAANGEFSPPTLATLEKAFDEALRQYRGRVFVDLWDLEQFSACPCCFEQRRRRLHEMNLQQRVLPRVCCERR